MCARMAMVWVQASRAYGHELMVSLSLPPLVALTHCTVAESWSCRFADAASNLHVRITVGVLIMCAECSCFLSLVWWQTIADWSIDGAMAERASAPPRTD